MSSKQLAVCGKLFIIIIFSVFGLLACAEKKFEREFVIAESKSYEASLFRQNCAICHGQEANGKELADGKKVPSLRYGDAAKKTESEIYEQIKNGKLPMPAFRNQLSEQDIQRMVKFVTRDLQGRNEGSN